ncbi:MAG: DUF3578 domain-containing protein, partial [Bacteroidetes bacterium]|nr:DUF3578 domain-containing protein [Bacteroidota bacterium]
MPIKQKFQNILEGYLRAKGEDFSNAHPISQNFEEITTQLKQLPLVKYNPDLIIKWSMGKGNWANVPWIVLMDKKETTTTQTGVYCVYLFKSDMSGVFVTFNQGVTKPKKEMGQTQGIRFLKEKAIEIRGNYPNLSGRGFSILSDINLSNSGLGKDYESSTIAHKLYRLENFPEDDEIIYDVNHLLEIYFDYIKTKPNDRNEKTTTKNKICLIGTAKDIENFTPKCAEFLKNKGGVANWWSFPINQNAILHNTPFFIYINKGNGVISHKYVVEKYESSNGSEGIISPWPERTFPEEIGLQKRGEKKSDILKTWILITKIEKLEPELDISDFEPAEPYSNRNSLLNQNAFGYAYLRKPKTMPKFSIEGLPKNLILYGPPGTGKTYKLIKEFMPNFEEVVTSKTRQEKILEMVEEMSWWQVIAAVLIEQKRPLKVREIKDHEIFTIKASLNNRAA